MIYTGTLLTNCTPGSDLTGWTTLNTAIFTDNNTSTKYFQINDNGYMSQEAKLINQTPPPDSYQIELSYKYKTTDLSGLNAEAQILVTYADNTMSKNSILLLNTLLPSDKYDADGCYHITEIVGIDKTMPVVSISVRINKLDASTTLYIKDIYFRQSTGYDGIQGPQGPQGKSLRMRGTWTEGVVYNDDPMFIDVVSWKGSSFSCKIDNLTATIDNKPDESATPQDNTWWAVVAIQGIQGPIGGTYVNMGTYDPNTTYQNTASRIDTVNYMGSLFSSNIDNNKGNTPPDTATSNVYWSLMIAKGDKGEQGIPGVVTYTWVKYADDINGTNMSDSPIDKKYVGLAFNKTSVTASTNAADYSWSLISDDTNKLLYINKDTDFLFHYDTSNVSTRGLAASVTSLTSLRRNEGKFGGAVAIEESTTNLFLNPRMENLDNWSGSNSSILSVQATSPGGLFPEDITICVKNTVAMGQNTGHTTQILNLNLNTVYTYTTWVFIPSTFRGTATLEVCYNNNGWVGVQSLIIAERDRWVRKRLTFTSNATYAAHIFKVGLTEAVPGDASYVCLAQMEQKQIDTSFTLNTRANGKLMYTLPSLNNFTYMAYKRHRVDNTFTHLTLTKTDNTFNLYKDGTLDNTSYKNKWVCYAMCGVNSNNKTGDIASYCDPRSKSYLNDAIQGSSWSSYKLTDSNWGYLMRTFVYASANVTIWHRYSADNIGGIRVNNNTPQTLGGYDFTNNPDIRIDLVAGWNVIEIWYMDYDDGGRIQLQKNSQGANIVGPDTTVGYVNSIPLSLIPQVLYMTAEMPIEFSANQVYFNEKCNALFDEIYITPNVLTSEQIKTIKNSNQPFIDSATQTFTWIKYADDENGTNMSDISTDKDYIGVAVNKYTPIESTNASEYSWTRITGAPGLNLKWNLDGVSIDGKGRLRKSSTTLAWDAQAYTTDAYTGACMLVFKPNQTTTLIMGLNTDPATSIDYTSIDCAWYLTNADQCAVYESGNRMIALENYTAGDVFSIVYDNNTVRYYHNGILKYTNTTITPNLLFAVDSSFWQTAANYQLYDIYFAPIGAKGDKGDKGDVGPILDWVQDWDGSTVQIKGTSIVTPKIFAGTNGGTSSAPVLSGVALGRDVLGTTNATIGIVGYNANEKTFEVDTAGAVTIGKDGSRQIKVDPSTGTMTIPTIYTDEIQVVTTNHPQEDGLSLSDFLSNTDSNITNLTQARNVEKINRSTDHYVSLDINVSLSDGTPPRTVLNVAHIDKGGMFDSGYISLAEDTTNKLYDNSGNRAYSLTTSADCTIAENTDNWIISTKVPVNGAQITATVNPGILSTDTSYIFSFKYYLTGVVTGEYTFTLSQVLGAYYTANNYTVFDYGDHAEVVIKAPVQFISPNTISWRLTATKECSLYLYDLQLEAKDAPTPFVRTSRLSSILNYGDPTKLFGTKSLTFNMWYKPGLVYPGFNNVCSTLLYCNDNMYIRFVGTTAIEASIRIGSIQYILTANLIMSGIPKQWHMVTLSVTAEKATLYFDGTPCAQAQYSNTNDTLFYGRVNSETTGVFIGCDSLGMKHLNGSVDELFFSIQGFDDSSVDALYKLGRQQSDIYSRVIPPAPTNVTTTII